MHTPRQKHPLYPQPPSTILMPPAWEYLQAIPEDSSLFEFDNDASGNRANLEERRDTLSPDNYSSISTFSTNYTMSNLIGAGRTLGNLYSSAGKKIEHTLNRAAHRAGYGPDAIYQKLLNLRFKTWVTKREMGKDQRYNLALTDADIFHNEESRYLDLCNSLFEYSRWVSKHNFVMILYEVNLDPETFRYERLPLRGS